MPLGTVHFQMNPFAIRYSAIKNEGVGSTDRMSVVGMVEQDRKGKDSH